MDKLILQKERPIPSAWKAVTISIDLYNEIKDIAELTGKSLSNVACQALEFALERTEIEGVER